MNYIDIKTCLSKIDEKRINIYDYANIYVSASENCMYVGFAYSQKREDEFTLLKITNDDIDLSEKIWQECLSLAMMLKTKYNVELIIDDVRDNPDISEVLYEEAYVPQSISVTYQLDRVQELRLQRLTSEFNSLGIDYSMEDTLQAIMMPSSINDIDKNLAFFEELLVEKEVSMDV